MKAIIYAGGSDTALVDINLPEAKADEVLVDVVRAGICGTDIGALARGRPKLNPGVVLGHEFVGRRIDDGTLVVGNPIVGCMQCEVCAKGTTHLCMNRAVLGVHRAGAFAERIAVPARNLVSADGLTAAQAALADPLATALHAWRLAPQGSTRVAVLGAGAIGLCAIAVLKAAGVAEIIVTDVVGERLEYAMALGATSVGNQPAGTFDCILDAVGTDETRKQAVGLLRPGGTAVLIGLHAELLSVPAGLIIGGERVVRGAFAYTEAEFVEATRMAAGLDTSWVREVPMDSAVDTLSTMVSGRAAPRDVKVHIEIGR
ncbi:zinc-dependent alcohol dehydrogenase [Burkholderia sp. PU8-34]